MMKEVRAKDSRFYAAFVSSAASFALLTKQLSMPNRIDIIFSALLAGAAYLLMRLFRFRGNVRLQYEMNALLIFGCICSAGGMMAKLGSFLRYTRFCDVGTAFLAGIVIVFFCAVFEKGSVGAERFAVISAAGILFLLLLVALFGKGTINVFHLASDSGHRGTAALHIVEGALYILPLLLSTVHLNGVNAVFICTAPLLLCFIPAAVFGGIISKVAYPLYEALLCMDSELLQGLDGIVFTCVLLAVLCHITACAACISKALQNIQCSCRARYILVSVLAAVAVLVFSSFEKEIAGWVLFYILLASITLKCVSVLCGKGGRDEAKN